MNKLCLILLTVSICATGCTTSYTIRVNGFSELDQPIKEKSSIHVAMDPNSQNPIFDKEIKSKIEILLKLNGYTPAPDVKQADYRLIFQVGLDSHGVRSYTPFYHPYSGFYNRYWGNYDLGYTRYVPYLETFYDQWLIMKVFDTGPADTSENGKVVWIGEAMISTDAADLRQIVNYLLVAGFEYFGVDTNRQIALTIGPDDPRIIRISALR